MPHFITIHRYWAFYKLKTLYQQKDHWRLQWLACSARECFLIRGGTLFLDTRYCALNRPQPVYREWLVSALGSQRTPETQCATTPASRQRRGPASEVLRRDPAHQQRPAKRGAWAPAALLLTSGCIKKESCVWSRTSFRELGWLPT